MIYLDNAATTAVKKEILDTYNELNCSFFANPSSPHRLGKEVDVLLLQAKKNILSTFNLDNHRVIFTSGATEANNMFLKGAYLNYKNRGNKIVTSAGEHPSVRATLYQLAKHLGAEIVEIPLLATGEVDLEKLKKAIDKNTIICSLIAVNNETGAINDIEEVAMFLKSFPKCLFHVDATQAIGKIELSYQNVDAFTFSAHKLGGVKGSGALIVKKHIKLVSLLSGGTQEEGYRAGTPNVAANIVLAKTLRLAIDDQKRNEEKIKAVFSKIMSFLQSFNRVKLNSTSLGSPYIVNFSLLDRKASVIVEALSNKDINVGTLSACSSRLDKLSPTVLSMTNDENFAANTIRVSFSNETKLEEVDEFITELKNVLDEVKYG